RVRSHVVERIGRPDVLAGHYLRKDGGNVGRPQVAQLGGSPGVAMVEPDDAEPAAHKTFAKRVRPAGHRRVKPMDEKDRRIAFAPEAFVGDIDSVGADRGHDFPCEIGGWPWSGVRNSPPWYDPVGASIKPLQVAAQRVLTKASASRRIARSDPGKAS